MVKSKIKIILALLDLVLLAQQGKAFNYPEGEQNFHYRAWCLGAHICNIEDESLSYRPWSRLWFNKRFTNNDEFIAGEESDNNEVLEDQDDNMMKQSKVNSDEDKTKEKTYPLYGPTRDVELFEDTMDSDEEEDKTNSNEERKTTNPRRGEQFDRDIKKDPEFYVRTMLRPTRAQFMVRPTRSFMARPTRAQFMVRPTRNSMARLSFGNLDINQKFLLDPYL